MARMRLAPGRENELTETSGHPPDHKPADGGTKVKIVIPDDHSMVSLLGSRDELLHVIEEAFDADIHVRGNEITITGSAEETARVAGLFEELTKLLAGGPELTADAVQRVVAML